MSEFTEIKELELVIDRLIEQGNELKAEIKKLRNADVHIAAWMDEVHRLEAENEKLTARITELEIELLGHEYAMDLLTNSCGLTEGADYRDIFTRTRTLKTDNALLLEIAKAAKSCNEDYFRSFDGEESGYSIHSKLEQALNNAKDIIGG